MSWRNIYGIAKDHYKFFKEQINVINNNRDDDVNAEDCVKTEDGETAGDMHHIYVS